MLNPAHPDARTANPATDMIQLKIAKLQGSGLPVEQSRQQDHGHYHEKERGYDTGGHDKNTHQLIGGQDVGLGDLPRTRASPRLVFRPQQLGTRIVVNLALLVRPLQKRPEKFLPYGDRR